MTNISNMIGRRHSENGAVSLFVVIFAMLIITVLTTSFLRLMISDQTQATNASLAEGARNSALAGVEDAKRALLRYKNYCSDPSNTVADCAALELQLTSDVCNRVVRIEDVITSDSVASAPGTQEGEVIVQQTQSGSDSLLEQAYTCVTATLNTDDYLGSVDANGTVIVPLVGTGAFDRVSLEWFSREDVSSTNATATVDLQSTSSRTLDSSWPANRPSLLRAQLMQFGSTGFTLESFDTTTPSGQSNTNTLFLHPTSNAASVDQSFTGRDPRRTSLSDETLADSSTDTTLGIRCRSTLESGGYACSTTLVLPEPVNGGARTAYLRLTPFYNSTHFRVKMFNGGSTNLVQFRGVQPEIDSTGRANNVFKRLSARVDLGASGSAMTFPPAAVTSLNNFCKDFSVTNTEYIAGSCTP